MTQDENVDSGRRWRRRFLELLVLVAAAVLFIAGYTYTRFGGDMPVDYANPVEHFKYGSTGGEHGMGFPYWIWRAMPQVCAKFLPGKGYASLGMTYEKGADGRDKDLPIGVSKRRYQGVDRVFLNCAVCHSSTMRKTKDTPPEIFPAMPANTFNIMAFEKFFFSCAADAKFTKEWLISEIDNQGGHLDLLDRYVVYPIAIAIMRERVAQLAGRFAWIHTQQEWGPGRVDTFNSAKVLFNFPMVCDKEVSNCLGEHELNAPGDFPAIWNQRQKIGMQLHWDGDNNLTNERNKSAAFGTGTTPPTIDIGRIARVEDWLLDAKPPAFSKYFPVDDKLAARGAGVYKAYCASCHGANGQSFALPESDREVECLKPGDSDEGLYAAEVGRITPWEQIRTDRRRLDSYTRTLAVNQSTLYAGYPWRFCHFRKTFGYANMPLDGLWLRAPYLHNGSVPTLRDLLEPAAGRPAQFYRGNDLYDPVKVGFVSNVAQEGARKYFKYDTTAPGNGNGGHEGKPYGTELSDKDKDALVEFLKTF